MEDSNTNHHESSKSKQKWAEMNRVKHDPTRPDPDPRKTECPLMDGAVPTSKSKFDKKIEAYSAKMYFHYYGQLLHQQNMLQDFVRTGTLLVNERMPESYVIERDRFLVQNGKMFPTIGRIHMAPFSDEYLYMEVANKAAFWQQQNYFGVDLTPLPGSAYQGYFSQPVVDAFDPRLLVAPAVSHVINFTSIKEDDLYEINIPLRFISFVSTRILGLACWFDVLFDEALCSGCTYNSLVSASVRLTPATLCHARTGDNWSASPSCPLGTKLYHLPHIVCSCWRYDSNIICQTRSEGAV